MATRDTLLDVTAALFAEHGWRGTTTRRIARAAGVNEVTIFRQFGSKEALLLAAVHAAAEAAAPDSLPDQPMDPHAELGEWAARHHDALRRRGSLIRSCLAEFEEHPELTPVATRGAEQTALELTGYLRRAAEAGLFEREAPCEVAAAMLMNALFLDAIARDLVPRCAEREPRQMIDGCIELMLRGLGWQAEMAG